MSGQPEGSGRACGAGEPGAPSERDLPAWLGQRGRGETAGDMRGWGQGEEEEEEGREGGVRGGRGGRKERISTGCARRGASPRPWIPGDRQKYVGK